MKTIKTSIQILFAVVFFASCGNKDDGYQTCKLTAATVVTTQEVCDLDGNNYEVVTTVEGIVSDTIVTEGSMSAYIASLEQLQYTCE